MKRHHVHINLPIKSFEFDQEARAIYLTVASGKVDRTKRISDSVFVDVDRRGKTLGIELLRVRGFQGLLSPILDTLAKTYPLKSLVQQPA